MKSSKSISGELPILLFEHQEAWLTWLDEHHREASGLWLRLAKKGAPISSVTYQEALEIALCYGWIDGQKKSHDSESWLQRFTPRGPRSIWSKINCAKAEELIASGRMRPAGLSEIERAKGDGRWEAAYDSSRNATVPDDLQAELESHPRAKSFFATLNSANRYAILFRIQTAKKPETRARRIAQFIEMLEHHQLLHP